MKRILSLALALLMMVSIIPFQIFAEGEPVQPECDQNCNVDAVSAHAETCAVKIYYRDLYTNSTAQELYDIWQSLSADAQSYIMDTVSWNVDQTKRAELVQLLESGSSTDPSTSTDPTDPPVAPEVPKLDDEESGVVLKGTFPTDVSLSVEPADVSGQLSQFGVSGEKLVFGLDISLMRSGADYQPGAAVRVKVPVFADVGTKIGILHTHGGETTYMGLTEVQSDGTVEFTTDRFSTFAGFTVDFHYNEIDYSIGGLTTITLSELFVALEIDRNAAHVIDVTYSDPSQIEVTRIDGDWQLESLKAFDTEETLEITFYDGEIITIKVTDSRVYFNFGSTGVTGHTKDNLVEGTGTKDITVILYDGNTGVELARSTVKNVSAYSYVTLDGGEKYWLQVKSIDGGSKLTNNPYGSEDQHHICLTYAKLGDVTIQVNCWPSAIPETGSSNFCTIRRLPKVVANSSHTETRNVYVWVKRNGSYVKVEEFNGLTFPDRNGDKNGHDVIDADLDLTASAKKGYTYISKSDDGNRTYNVYLEPTSYTISYMLDGGSASNPTSYNIETATFTLKEPTKTGYIFLGWTGSNGSTPQKTVTIEQGTTENKSYTANWEAEPVSYTVTWVYGNGTENKVETVACGAAITKPANPTRTGYNFTGWSPDVPETMPAEDQTFTAQWEGKKYTLTVYAKQGSNQSSGTYPVQYGSNSYNDLSKVLTDPIPGYELTGFYTEQGGSGVRVYDEDGKWLTGTDYWDDEGNWKYDGDLTVRGNWDLIEYTITYVDTLDNTTTTAKYTTYLPAYYLEGRSREGYNFGGWKVKETAGHWATGDIHQAGASCVGLYGDVTLETVWTPIEYSITYELNGGDLPNGVTSNTQNYNVEQAVTLMAAPEKVGWKFIGWKLETENGNWTDTDYTAGQTITEGKYGNITLAAQWKNQYRYVLSFNSNGGSTVEPITKEWCDDAEWTFTWDQTKNPTRTGYTFMGWATEANSNDVVIGPDSNSYKITGTPTETETKTLHAIWQRNTGTVVLDYSGDGAPVIVTVECTTSEGGVDSEKIRIQTVITGDVTLSNLPTGTYSVTAEPGRGNYTASANPGSVTIGKGESKTVTVTTGAKGNNWLTGFARAINRCS